MSAKEDNTGRLAVANSHCWLGAAVAIAATAAVVRASQEIKSTPASWAVLIGGGAAIGAVGELWCNRLKNQNEKRGQDRAS